MLENYIEIIKPYIIELFESDSSYGSVVFYYDLLYRQVIEEYKKGNTDLDKIKLCAEIMNNYYAGVTYIDNFFNV